MIYQILFVAICCCGAVLGIVEYIHERKHGKKESGGGFWVGLLIFSAILDLIVPDKKKK